MTARLTNRNLKASQVTSQDFIHPHFGTPTNRGAIVVSPWSRFSGNSNAHPMIGFSDGTNQVSVAALVLDFTDPTFLGTVGSATRFIQRLTGGPIQLEGDAAFSQWITNGLQVDILDSFDQPWDTNTYLLGGDDWSFLAGSFKSNPVLNGTLAIDCGFTPDQVIFVSNGQALDGVVRAADMNYSVGFADSVGPANRSVTISSQEGITPAVNARSWSLFSETRISALIAAATGLVTSSVEVTAFLSGPTDGFEVTTRDGTANPDIAFLAIKYSPGTSHVVASDDTPAVLGLENINLGFRPELVLYLSSYETAAGTPSTGSEQGIGALTAYEQYATTHNVEDQQATFRTFTGFRDLFSVFQYTATAEATITAIREAITPTGYDLNWTTLGTPGQPGTGRKLAYMAFEGPLVLSRDWWLLDRRRGH